MDITSDGPHAVLIQINDAYGLPEYVKTAAFLEAEDAKELPPALFADRFNRRYPINSKADTWLSAAYFAKTAEADGYAPALYEHIGNTIKTAAAAYGIARDVEDIMAKISAPEVEKQAEDDDLNYGYPELKMYPMFNDEGVKLAGAYFDENRFSYPADMRKTLARNIMRKAAESGVDVPDSVRREACMGMPRIDFMSIQIIDRAHRAPTEKLASIMEGLNQGLMAATATDLFEVLEKTAEVISDFDRMTGLDQEYGRKVLAPADFMFDVSNKQAQAYVDDAVQLGNCYFSIEKLAELPEHVYTDALGDDFMDRVKDNGVISTEKLANELYSMPLPDKNALLDSIKANTL